MNTAVLPASNMRLASGAGELRSWVLDPIRVSRSGSVEFRSDMALGSLNGVTWLVNEELASFERYLTAKSLLMFNDLF